jgi:glycyl-tRNA synthetase beta chain
LGVDIDTAERAAHLSKADLTTGVVGEFPELQGVMGRYYALHDKEDAVVADAIRDHYKPVGPSDFVPTDKISVIVALADKFDLLTGFFAIDEKPTGSGDPFALRRAALGVIRLLLQNELRISLSQIVEMQAPIWLAYARDLNGTPLSESAARSWKLINEEARLATESGKESPYSRPKPLKESDAYKSFAAFFDDVRKQLLTFFADRLKVALKEKGVRHDLIDAVFSLGNEDDLVRLVARVEALQAFLKSDDGANLLAGYKRAVNILKLEEKKDGKTFVSEVSEKLLTEPAEKSLFATLTKARAAITAALGKEDFVAAMQQMASLRVPVDSFFEGVKVNADDKQMRENWLSLLASLRATLHQVADFSKIEG